MQKIKVLLALSFMLLVTGCGIVIKDEIYSNYGVYCKAGRREYSTECEVVDDISNEIYGKRYYPSLSKDHSIEIILKDESTMSIEEYRSISNKGSLPIWQKYALIEIDLISGKGLKYEINFKSDGYKNSKPKNEKTIVEEFEFDPEIGPIHRFFEKDNTYCEIDYSTLQTECFNGNKR